MAAVLSNYAFCALGWFTCISLTDPKNSGPSLTAVRPARLSPKSSVSLGMISQRHNAWRNWLLDLRVGKA